MEGSPSRLDGMSTGGGIQEKESGREGPVRKEGEVPWVCRRYASGGYGGCHLVTATFVQTPIWWESVVRGVSGGVNSQHVVIR